MGIIQFKNRKKELRELRKILGRDRFEFLIIYGRRRIGKTSLILEATKNLNKIYFLATEENNLERFYRICERKFPDIRKLRMDYEVLFDYLKDKVDVIIIDEFQNMIKEDKNILSVFQVIVDEILSRSKVKLILLGSSVSMMSSKVLSYKSPLYGRRTASLKLEKIRFLDLKEFFPEKDVEELVRIYGFADGIPFYLVKIDPKKKFLDWLREEINNPLSFLKDEMDFLMRYEFEDVGTYKMILEAIAFGKTKISEIKSFVGLERTDITPYLRNLIETGFVKREVPVTESLKSRRGRYYLKDNFSRFWFRFIYPNLSLIEEGSFDFKIIEKEYPEYLGFVFEEICKEILSYMRKFRKIGRWWYKDAEIDIVGLGDEIFLAECKWREKVDAEKVCGDLYRKSDYFEGKKCFCVFAKSFKRRISEFDGIRVFCYDLKDIERVLLDYQSQFT